MTFRKLLLRRSRVHPAVPQTHAELITELIEAGFLELRLSEKSHELLAADPTKMDDYLYWCVHIHARKAYAIVEGYSVEAAGVGGPWRQSR